MSSSRGSPLGEVVVDHGPGNSNSGYPDAATVAPATDPMPSQLAQDLVGSRRWARSPGPARSAELRHGELPVSWPIAATTTRGPRGWAWRVVVAGRAHRWRCRALADQVEGAEAGHGLGDETACHTVSRATATRSMPGRSWTARRTATAPVARRSSVIIPRLVFYSSTEYNSGRMRCEGSLRIGHPRSRNGGDRLTRRVLSRHLGHGTGQVRLEGSRVPNASR